MSDPLKVHVRGPLVPLVIGFRGSLAASGYAPNTVSQQLQLMLSVTLNDDDHVTVPTTPPKLIVNQHDASSSFNVTDNSCSDLFFSRP